MRDVLDRPEGDRAASEFLASATRDPSVMVIEGEAGIGKTTQWSKTVAEAQRLGFRVLATRPAQTESAVAYTALADLLNTVDTATVEALPSPQRSAIDRILLRDNESEPPTQPRAVAAAFLSVVEALAKQTPVLIAIDDVQWLDSSSVFAVEYATRRLSGAIGVLATVRTEAGTENAAGWLLRVIQPRLTRVSLPPFAPSELADLLAHRVRRPLPRRVLDRIQRISAGNPFYALELARVAEAEPPNGAVDPPFPSSLADLVRTRIGGLAPNVRSVLVIAAAAADPTVELVARAIRNTTADTVELLEIAESAGIVTIDGTHVGFAHPLLGSGVYSNVDPATRRRAHRLLAAVVDEPELRARHLALGATSADSATLESLDAAAELARRRGAPAAAAELLDLAERLGDERSDRQIRSASFHFEAGDAGKAEFLLRRVMDRLDPGPLRASAASLLATIVMYAEGFGSAADILERFLPDADTDAGGGGPLLIHMLMALGYTLMNVGRKRESLNRVDEAVVHSEHLGHPTVLRRALGLRVVMGFMAGWGVDHANLQRALALDDDRSPTPLALQPEMQHAVLMAWTGELDVGRERLASIQRRRSDNGEESEWVFISYHRAMVEIWRADFDAADEIARQMMNRSVHLEGDVALSNALAIRSSLAAYAGRADEARRDALAALDASDRAEGRELAGWVRTTLGFLEVSLGNYQAAFTVLRPTVDGLLADPDYTEIIVAEGVTDAVTAMAHLDRVDEASELVELMERNGRRLDRTWMLAVALRGRAVLLAARGDVDSAAAAAADAMAAHERLPMPFERARTQLLLGQLQRRQRSKDNATASLTQAVAAFDALNTPLWAARARGELARVKPARRVHTLTPSELRVAELAAAGMTNRAIAAQLFISPKTVNTNLTRIYDKLGIHSRAELARRIIDR